MNKNLMGLAAAAAAGLVGASAASAQQTILTFGFTDLSGSFTTGTSQFTAVGVNNPGGLQSQGDVSRLENPNAGSATYGTGQAAGLVNVSLTVSSILANTANGMGTITITDADGDTLTANINGQFIGNGPAVFFNGSITNPAFHDNGTPDGTFNGPGGGSIPLSFAPAPPPYTGAIVQLYINTTSAFFTQNFSGLSTQVSGAIVPAPASLALLGLGGLVAGRRRRA